MTNRLYITALICFTPFWAQSMAASEHLVSVQRFGAVADAKRVGETYIGTDNSSAFNRCAAYCRKNGLTMFIPKGDYGVASTVWLTNPELDSLKQASICVIGSNLGAYTKQKYSANICVLKEFQAGRQLKVQKKNGQQMQEPHFIPVLGISNGRQVHIKGIGILAGRMEDYICGIAIGNISQMTSIKNCSLFGMQAGIVFPGIRSSKDQNVVEGNNDLLVVEQTDFVNKYCIVCAGTQPFACEYRNNSMSCSKSIFTGTLITNEHGHTRGSHKFSSNLFGTFPHKPEESTIYFDLMLNEVVIDSCHFETGWIRKEAEVILRAFPNGGFNLNCDRLSFTNNMVNIHSQYENSNKYNPLFDTQISNRMYLQGNHFYLKSPLRFKADGAILIGNHFQLMGEHAIQVKEDPHYVIKDGDQLLRGLYDFNHFIVNNSDVSIQIEQHGFLKKGQDFKVDYKKNAFELTQKGIEAIKAAGANRLLVSYNANDASRIRFTAWGGNRLNSPHGWKSRNLTFIANKVVYKDDRGISLVKELVKDYTE